MKNKPICIAATTLIITQSVLAQIKSLDFYSSGSNRYSISGKIKDLDIPTQENSILISDANNEAYVKLNNEFPYYANLIENDLDISQIINFNKGKSITYKGDTIKIISAQHDKVIAESKDNIIVIPLSEISLPKAFIIERQKGLKASFLKNINPDDSLFFSQPERQLSYYNSYESVISGDNIHFSHYFNINNSSLKTFENIYLNFFLSETNIQDRNNLRPMMSMAPMAGVSIASVDNARPVFNNDTIQNLKKISIKESMNIYPNFNKIKYIDKNYSIDEYAQLQIEDKYEISIEDISANNFFDSEIKKSKSYIERVEQIKNAIKSSSNQIYNIIEIKTDKEDIFPPGKLSIYSNLNGQDKLIVSTNIAHTENKNLTVVKNINNDLKIIKVGLQEADSNLETKKIIFFKIKSLEIENLSDVEYTFNCFGKKEKIPSKSTINIVY